LLRRFNAETILRQVFHVKARRQLARIVLAILFAIASPAVASAQLNVLMSGGFAAAYKELLPEFERTSHITVTTASGSSQGNGPNTIGAQLARGVATDVVVMNKVGLADLISQGKIVPGTAVDLAQTALGLAVRSGSPKLDTRTVEAFKQTLLRAKSVTLDSSTTGIYLTTTLFPRLGIAEEMKRKSTTDGAPAVGRGEAEIAVQPISELLPVQGIELVGKLPEDVQYYAVFSAAAVQQTSQLQAAKQLIDFLSSASAASAIRKSGMEPVKPR
jgi:molybdate transport system substrate-binding protein